MSERIDKLNEKINTRQYRGMLHPDYKTILTSIEAAEEIKQIIIQSLAEMPLGLEDVNELPIVQALAKIEESITELENTLFIID